MRELYNVLLVRLYKKEDMFDLSNLMGKVKEAQSKMKEVQESLVHIIAEGESGAGLVTATVNGHKKLVKLSIDKDLAKPGELSVMEDLIVAAVNKALDEVDVKTKEEVKNSTQGMMPNIPGFNFGDLV